MDEPRGLTATAEPSTSLVTWTHVIYGLHAFSLLTGILGAATIVGAFLTGWPSIIAVILNYVKRADVRGTWLDSHFSWQIRTFWLALLWLAIGGVLFVTVVAAFLTGWPSLIAVVLNYVKRSETRGTWLESHFRWQLRTFWYGLLWVGLCLLFVVATLGIGLLIAWIPLAVVGLWFIYRIVRGWLALVDRRPMDV